MRLALVAALLLAGSCPSKGEAPAPDPPGQPQPKDGNPGAEAKPPTNQAQVQRIAAAIKTVEENAAVEAKRWNPRLTEATRRLIDREYKDASVALDAILASPHRKPGNSKRDEYRHPSETLLFFRVTRRSVVVEMFPGGGWYTEIVAPLVAKRGKLVVPAYDPQGPSDSFNSYLGRMLELLLGKSDALFGKVERIPQADDTELDLGPPESADVVLAIREMHNWYRFGNWDDYIAAAHRVLRPGGRFGVVQHRAPPGAEPRASANEGYLPELWLIEEVEARGFKLQDKSEVNANQRDTKDYDGGVWSLPPTLAEGKLHRNQYIEIGESDRMTLRFIKPPK